MDTSVLLENSKREHGRNEACFQYLQVILARKWSRATLKINVKGGINVLQNILTGKISDLQADCKYHQTSYFQPSRQTAFSNGELFMFQRKHSLLLQN